jgi:hypothetical protein
MPLPTIDSEAIVYLFGVVIASLAIYWGINKAIQQSKH